MSRDDSLTIGDVSRRTGLAASAVRYYESIGLLPEPRREGGWRRYEPDVVERIRSIQRATRAGFSLDEVRRLLADETNPMPALARARLATLQAEREAIEQRIGWMERAAECGCASWAECSSMAEQQGL